MTQHFAKLENSPRLQHTKGPWTCVDEDGRLLAGAGVYLISTGAPNRLRVAKVDVPIYGVPISKEEAQANARLIASAPELLEACKAAAEYLKNHVWGCGQPGTEACLTDDKLQKAIAKAGGQP